MIVQIAKEVESINILILSVGRRVELIKCFKDAARRLGIENEIFGADCQETAPALYFADRRVLLPRISEPNYIDTIIHVCKKHNIRLVVPTIDTDLLLLAESKERIETLTKAKVLISELDVIRICRDKIKTHKFLMQEGFGVPKLYLDEELDSANVEFPLFIKPIDGSSSINAFRVNNFKELDLYRQLIPRYMVQEFINGDEYTVDAFLDFDSNIVSIVPRLRLATRTGEIAKGKIVKDNEIISDVKRLFRVLKPVGHVTVQCMKTDKSIQYIEINPRFGGGAPMSIKSGADSCEGLYRLLRGEKLSYHEDYQDGLLFLRFDDCIILNDRNELVGCNGDFDD